jgi:hypothetical protein
LTADSGALGDGLNSMRRGAKNLREQNARLFNGVIALGNKLARIACAVLQRRKSFHAKAVSVAA